MKKEGDTVRKREVKVVLFDLDGVLVDSMRAWFYVFNDTLRHFGFKKLMKKNFAKGFGSPIEQDIKNHFTGKTITEVVNCFDMYFKKRKNLVKIFPESKKVLSSLKKRSIKLALLSNSTRFIVLAILNHFKIRKYFDVVLTMQDVKSRKPAPEMVLKACKKLVVKPENAIVVGDTKYEMIAGRRAGCVTVGFKINGDY